MNFIKKIVDGKVDEQVHLQFQKFSRGEFRDRAIIKARQVKGKFTINLSAEFANELVKVAAEKLGDEKTKVTGAIVSTSNLKAVSEFHDLMAHVEVKQFQGVKRFLIDLEMSGKEILRIIETTPKSFFALSFNVSKDDTVLKIKPKAPKSGKPGKGDEEPKADFCKLVTNDKEWGTSFVFENPNFSKAEIKHNFFIEKMVIPEELKSEKDFSKVRELAQRQGKIERISLIDDKETKKEIEFLA